MELEFSEDEAALIDNVQTVLATACPPSLVRAVFEGDGDGEALWKQLVELDWPAIGLPEEVGGLGLGYIEVAIVVDGLGRVVAPVPFLPTVTQFAPAVRELDQRGSGEQFLRAVATGESTGTLALAEDGRWEASMVRSSCRPLGGGEWALTGTKSTVLHGQHADEVVVVARADGSEGDDGLGAFVVPRSSVAASPRGVIDPTMPLADLSLDEVTVGPERVLAEPGDPIADGLARTLQEATTALAVSTVATCRTIFETTLEYVKVREQFERPIGSFQALKHRLAEMYLSLERASALSWYAALTIAEDDPRRAEAASLAKAAAGECQRLLAGDGLQLHGGIGFTWEYDLHFFLKRAKTGDALFGSAAWHRGALAERLGLRGEGVEAATR